MAILKILFLMILTGLTGCSSPGNYLTPKNIQAPQKIGCHYCNPRLITINADLCNSLAGVALIKNSIHPRPYQVGAYDNLNILIWGHPELSTLPTSAPSSPLMTSVTQTTMNSSSPIIVQPDGCISYPLVGELQVCGLTVREIEQAITQRLCVYIRHPQVTVQVAKFRNRNIFVLGEVKVPGQQPLTDKPLSLMEAVSIAGVDPVNADTRNIYLIRGTYQHPTIFWWPGDSPQALLVAEHFLLQEDDIVYVCAGTLTSWNRFINQILPSLETYFLIRSFAR